MDAKIQVNAKKYRMHYLSNHANLLQWNHYASNKQTTSADELIGRVFTENVPSLSLELNILKGETEVTTSD